MVEDHVCALRASPEVIQALPERRIDHFLGISHRAEWMAYPAVHYLPTFLRVQSCHQVGSHLVKDNAVIFNQLTEATTRTDHRTMAHLYQSDCQRNIRLHIASRAKRLYAYAHQIHPGSEHISCM